MRARSSFSILLALGLGLAPAFGQTTFVVPANGVPLHFGMTAEEVSQALGVPLNYVRGRPGDELLLAIPNVKGSALSIRSDGLYLQFRKWRLTGWKGDWGTIRP
ncbi:hypothetical protein [Bradyrhizobium sp. ARR65]|uniref:hypothetical protein n=1 Tax=Bradyrhizobium sp. ARR65 TaxID=1040989 RepID=UPI0004677C89|nr:hypothetical protein [Bradyrhizobium sp. ARR65]